MYVFVYQCVYISGTYLQYSGNLIIKVEWTRPAQTGLGAGKQWTMMNYEFLADTSCDDDRRLSLPEAQTSIVLSDVIEGCTYMFRVRGQNEGGYGEYQNSSEVRALSLATAVRNLRATADRALQVNLTWQIPTNTGDGTSSPSTVEAYEVDVALGPVGTADFSAAVRKYSIKTPGMLVKLLELDVLYSFRVRVRNLAGFGAEDKQSATAIIPPLLDASANPSSNLSGADISVEFSFRLSTALDAQDRIVVRFPENFILQSAAVLDSDIGDVVMAVSDGEKLCGYRCVPSINDIFVTRQGAGQVMSAGSNVRLRFQGVVNRRWEGASGVFQVQTIDARGNYTIDRDLNVAGYALVAGPFAGLVASLDRTNTGEVTDFKLTFRSPRNPVPPKTIFVVTVGSEMILRDVTGMTISFGGRSSPLEVSVKDSSITGIHRADAEIPRNATLVITVASIRNRITRGNTGSVGLKMLTELEALMDSSTNVEPVPISAGKLMDATLMIADYRALATVSYVFSFKLGAVGLPVDSRVDVMFPNDILVDLAAFDDAAKVGVSGSFVLSRQGQTVSIKRNGGAEVAPNLVLSLPFSSVRNFYAGAPGNFSVQTVSTVNGIVMEELMNLTTADFVPGPLIVEDFSLSEYTTGSSVTMKLNLKTTGPFNLDGIHGGRFVLVLPPGFEWTIGSNFASDQTLTIDAATGVASTACVSRTWMKCQTLTIALPDNNNGGEWPGSTMIKMTMTGLQNTPLESEGFFHISTQSTAGRIGDLNKTTVVKITPRKVDAVFIPSSPLANMTGTYTVLVTGFNVLPPDCTFVFGFPDAVTFPGVGFPGVVVSPRDVSVVTDVAGDMTTTLVARNVEDVRSSRNPTQGVDISGNVTVLRKGELLAQNRQMTFTISPIWHRETSGHTAAFEFSLQTVDGIRIETSTISGFKLKYDTPRVDLISSVNGPATGLLSITLTGKNFGPIKANERVGGEKRAISFGGTVSTLTTWVSDTSIVCVLASGTSAPVAMVITVEAQESTTTFSFNKPVLTNPRFRNGPASGARILTFLGANLGPYHMTPKATFGMSTLAPTEWMSDSTISGKLAPGIGRTLRFSVSVDRTVGSGIGQVSYDSVALQNLVNATSAGARYGPKQIIGSGHAASSFSNTARLGNSGCEKSDWVSDSVLTCMPAAGVRGSLTATVTAGSYSGTITEGFSYLTVPALAGHVISNVPSHGGVTVEMDTRLILNGDYSVRVRNGDTTCISTLWKSHSSVHCATAPGRGDKLSLIMTAATSVGSVSQLMTYDWTQLTEALHEHERALNLPTSGNYALTMSGIDFGTFSTSPALRFGATAASVTAWQSNTEVYAKVAPGVGTSHAAKISVLMMQHDGQLTGVATYDAPQVLLVYHENQQQANVETDTYHFRENTPLRTVKTTMFAGHHLGYSDFTLKMRVGATECQRSLWTSVSSLSCRVAAGSSASLGLVATVAAAASTMTSVMTYDAPAALSSFSIGNFPGISHKVLHLHGLNFDVTGTSARVRAGLTSGEETTWLSESSILCNTGKGLGRSLHTSVTAGRSIGSVSEALSYDYAELKAVVRGANRPSFANPVYIAHLEFIPDHLQRGYSPGARIGPTAVQNTYWYTSTHMACKVAPGVGRMLAVVLTAGEQTSTMSSFYSFDAASIHTSSQVNGAASGGNAIPWTGQSFGLGINSISMRQGYSQCAATLWQSDSALTCKDMSGSSGRASAVVVSIFGVKDQTLTNAFSYDGPKVSRVDGDIALLRVSEILLSGTNFGLSDITLSAVLGATGCAATSWLSDTALKCSLREGFGLADVPLVAINDIRICKKCTPDEIIIGCTATSAGYCDTCEPCDAGAFRVECEIGTAARGKCVVCPTDGPVEQRQFKAIVGKASTQCDMCTVCGGRNQNGSLWEVSRCSTSSDTLCRPCGGCESGTRVGCQGENAGKCTVMDNGKITIVTGTITQQLLVQQVGLNEFVATADNDITLTGDNAGSGVTIVKSTRILFPAGGVSDEGPSVVVVASVLTGEMILESEARGMRLLSNLTYFDVSGTRFSPSAILHLRFNNSGQGRISVYRWGSDNMSWTELETQMDTTPDGMPIANAATDHFSAYAVFETALPKNMKRDYLEIILPIAIIMSLFTCAVVAMYWLKCRQNADDNLPLNELSKRVEPKNFFLMTENGPVELEVTGQPISTPETLHADPSLAESSLFLTQSPPKRAASPPKQPQTPRQGSPPPALAPGRIEWSTPFPRSMPTSDRTTPLKRQDSRVENSSLLISPYMSVGIADRSSMSNLAPLPNTRTPNMRMTDRSDFLSPSKYSSRASPVKMPQSPQSLSDENPLPSYLRSSMPARDQAGVLPSTDLAMLAMGFATPAKVSQAASRARSQDLVSATSYNTTDLERSPDLEQSLALLAMGFTTPLRASADTSTRALSHDREPHHIYDDTTHVSHSQQRAWQPAAQPERIWQPAASQGLRVTTAELAYSQTQGQVQPYVPQYVSSDMDQIDDDMFGYEQEQSSRGGLSNVDDVILSVGNDFTPQVSSHTASNARVTTPQRASHLTPQRTPQRTPHRRELDTPERFAATLQDDYDNEFTEFSIQPGTRRFLPREDQNQY